MEMGGTQLVMRMLGSVGFDQSVLKTGRLEDEHWGRLERSSSQAPMRSCILTKHRA